MALIDCPECKNQVSTKAESCPKCGAPLTEISTSKPAPKKETTTVNIEKRVKTTAGGIVVEVMGLVLCFLVFPFGLMIGVPLMFLGYGMSKALVCTQCGTSIDTKKVKVCPSCKAEFKGYSRGPGLHIFTKIILSIFVFILALSFALYQYMNKLMEVNKAMPAPISQNKSPATKKPIKNPTRATQSPYNKNMRLATTSKGLTNADLAWHALNTYGWDCSEVTERNSPVSGRYLITCSNGRKLWVTPRTGTHPIIKDSGIGSKSENKGNTTASDPDNSADVSKHAPLALEGKVIRVTNGDTIIILHKNEEVEVSLASIDCPGESQPFGKAAKKFTYDKIFGEYVRIKSDLHKNQHGQYIGVVYYKDVNWNYVNLNQELVKNGYAWWYEAHSTDRKLMQLEKEAKQEKRGLWASGKPIPPWDWIKDVR